MSAVTVCGLQSRLARYSDPVLLLKPVLYQLIYRLHFDDVATVFTNLLDINSYNGATVGSAHQKLQHNADGQIDVGVETVILTLDYVSLGFRLWSRNIQKSRYQINDWLIIIAIVCVPHVSRV